MIRSQTLRIALIRNRIAEIYHTHRERERITTCTVYKNRQTHTENSKWLPCLSDILQLLFMYVYNNARLWVRACVYWMVSLSFAARVFFIHKMCLCCYILLWYLARCILNTHFALNVSRASIKTANHKRMKKEIEQKKNTNAVSNMKSTRYLCVKTCFLCVNAISRLPVLLGYFSLIKCFVFFCV